MYIEAKNTGGSTKNANTMGIRQNVLITSVHG